jgi:uncharacterized protein YndB with AHSA1/START domain
MNDYGKVVGDGAVRFERVLPGPIERVWAYLTESEKRGKWLATGALELRVGGRVELRFRHADLSPKTAPPPDKYKKFEGGVSTAGRVTRCEPPRLLSYTWAGESEADSEVSFELKPKGNEVLLILTHRRLRDRAEMVDVSGGWHAHLEILAEHLNGREPKPFWSIHAPLEAQYQQRIASPPH